MKQVFRFDPNGFYIEPNVLEDNEPTPSDCTETQPPDGLYKGRFVNGQWFEGLSQEEIDAIKNAPVSLTQEEQNQKDLADLTFQLMLKGVI